MSIGSKTEGRFGKPASLISRSMTNTTARLCMNAMPQRLDHQPKTIGMRRQTAEQPLDTLKHWMGSTHVQTTMLPLASTDIRPLC